MSVAVPRPPPFPTNAVSAFVEERLASTASCSVAPGRKTENSQGVTVSCRTVGFPPRILKHWYPSTLSVLRYGRPCLILCKAQRTIDGDERAVRVSGSPVIVDTALISRCAYIRNIWLDNYFA